MSLSHMPGWQLRISLETRKISCREVLLSVLDEIDCSESKIQAFITIRDKKDLLYEADSIDARRLRGDHIGELAGIPIALKDNICTKNLLTTCASKMLSNFVPPYDATVVEHIRQADGIILGKTNMDEFCMGSSTEKSAFKITHNPNNLSYVPGGTSGGSAASVAANETIFALGVDTGGSIRQPASYCGVVGMKPTYGRVSRFGIIAYGSSFDQVGVLTKDVKDAAILMGIISGYDPKDSTSSKVDVPNFYENLDSNCKFRIGVPEEYFREGLNLEVKKSVKNAISLFQKYGHEVLPVELPHTEYAIPAYYVIVCCEASSNLARYSGTLFGFRASEYQNIQDMFIETRSKGFGPEVQRRILLGTYALSAGYYDAYYLKASKVRTLIIEDFKNAFKSCDIIAHPVAPEPAFKIGEKMVGDPLTMYLVDIFSVLANLAGLPAISIPCGLAKNNLPIGIQLTGKHFSDLTVLSAAYQLEKILQESGYWIRGKGSLG